jgi:hypothetical protein
MEIGSMGNRDAAFDRMYASDGKFSREEGEFGDLAPEAAAALYAPRIEKLFSDAGFGSEKFADVSGLKEFVDHFKEW